MFTKHAPLTLCLLSASIALALASNAPAANAADAQTTPSTTSTATTTPQPAAKPHATTLETIVVTARRRSEDPQKVPVAISAFSSEDLKDMQATDIAGIQGAVPNLNIVQGRGSSSNVNIFIRGIGQPDALQTFDPGVGFYVDDVYYSRINGALMDLFDIDHVEVLRGPQGTLYGMNSTGGAVKVVTKTPSDTPEGSVAVTVGDYGRVNTSAYLSGPISKTLSGSIAAGTFYNTGDVTDPVTGRHFNNDNTQAIRGKLDFHPSDRFNAILEVDYSHQNTDLTMGQATAPLENLDLSSGATPISYTPVPWDFHAQTSFGPDKGQKLTQEGVALHLNWKLGDDWDFKSITAYRKLNTAAYIDIDATPLQLGDVLVALRQHQLSQEFQLQYSNHDNLHAVFGLYFLDEHVPSHQEAYANDFLTYDYPPFGLYNLPIDFLRTIDDNLVNKSMAGFGNATWTIGNGWSLSGGLRYTNEKKTYYRTTSTFFGAPFGAADSTFAFDASKTWSAVTPSLALQKQFSPQLMWYISANRGFKSGGFNGRANTAVDESAFNPEFVWTYESGLKFRSADGRLTANGDVFYSDYKNFQARVSSTTDANGIPEFNFPVINAAKLTMAGAEFQGSMVVGAGTIVQAQVGYLNAKYDQFDDPLATPGLHAHTAFTPHWTARVAATHTFDLHDGSAITVGGDLSYRSTMWLSVDNRPGLMQPGYTLAGLFGVYDSANDRWQVRAGVRNLTNKTYKTDAQEFSSVGNIQTAYYGWPRNYYLTVRYNLFK